VIEKKENPECEYKKSNQARRVGTLDIILAALLEGRFTTLLLIGDAFLFISLITKEERGDIRLSILPVTLTNYLSLGIGERIIVIVDGDIIGTRPIILESKRDPRYRFHSSNYLGWTIRIRPLSPT
jgi:hypothetical protein